MKSRLEKLFIVIMVTISCNTLCFAEETGQFKISYESKNLIDSPFFLNTTADLNKNELKELIIADFGRFGDHIEEWKDWRKDDYLYNLLVLEWEDNELKLKWKKQWDMRKVRSDAASHAYFMAYEANQMVVWTIGNQVTVETIPPYLGLEWNKGKYVLKEQQGPFNKGPVVGSWVMPWISPSCYPSFPNTAVWPRECLVGIRDFSGKPKIVTILEDGEYSKHKLRVRKFEPSFPIEWERDANKKFVWEDPFDRLNLHQTGKILLREFKTTSFYLFSQSKSGTGYNMKPISAKWSGGIDEYDLPDNYLRFTQEKNIEEYWGYHKVDISTDDRYDFMYLLGKVKLKADLTGFTKEVIDFPHHDKFLSVGYFDVEDIDGDGLDEIILVEETGKKKFYGEESVGYSDIKDYIRILKWNGKEYQTMWVSPPYTKRGTKFLVEDIKNSGKKQLVVLSPYGTVQIWERQ